jgi:hypothetical protein
LKLHELPKFSKDAVAQADIICGLFVIVVRIMVQTKYTLAGLVSTAIVPALLGLNSYSDQPALTSESLPNVAIPFNLRVRRDKPCLGHISSCCLSLLDK